VIYESKNGGEEEVGKKRASKEIEELERMTRGFASQKRIFGITPEI